MTSLPRITAIDRFPENGDEFIQGAFVDANRFLLHSLRGNVSMSGFDDQDYFCTPNDPVPGLDSGLTGKVQSHRLLGEAGGLQLQMHSCRIITQAPRTVHSLEVLSGNRLDSDTELRIGGRDWKLVLGLVTSEAPHSLISDLENNRYGRIGFSWGNHTISMSNDIFGLNGNDHGYTGVGAWEYRGRWHLGNGLRIHAGRLRILGTTGIPDRDGGVFQRGDRTFYQQVKYPQANHGAVVLDVQGYWDNRPVELSVAIIDDRVRSLFQGMIHRTIDTPEFDAYHNARGFALLFKMQW